MAENHSKKIALYGMLTAAALVFGYVEYLVPLNFIAPGIKLGIANGVVLLLVLKGKFKEGICINIARIVLSAFLFSTPFSLVFSLTAGIISTAVMCFISRFKKVGVIGISVLGGAVHNLTQLCVAHFTVGKGVWFYLPLLLIAGLIAGCAVGILVWIILERFEKN